MGTVGRVRVAKEHNAAQWLLDSSNRSTVLKSDSGWQQSVVVLNRDRCREIRLECPRNVSLGREVALPRNSASALFRRPVGRLKISADFARSRILKQPNLTGKVTEHSTRSCGIETDLPATVGR